MEIIPAQGGEYRCINGRELEKITDEKDPYFWKEKGYNREEFKQFVIDSQEFFQKYMAGENCNSYRINGTVDAMYVYIHQCIKVEKTKRGYRCTSNGRHRCAVARRYKLPILVFVANE